MSRKKSRRKTDYSLGLPRTWTDCPGSISERRSVKRTDRLNVGARGGRRGRGEWTTTTPRRLPFRAGSTATHTSIRVVARGYTVHDRRMIARGDHTPGTQSISVGQRRVAASRFASHHVQLGPVRRVPSLASRLANRRCQPRTARLQPCAPVVLRVFTPFANALAREVAPIASAHRDLRILY
ncbi:hypothetical protein PUN28_017749 [Cardiocondyla obscurior]|uniref:Uncharacterized protein n=1 Tax=Cardiocondyla obscurior TaxID=286306 RepID=A0AAW2EK38_9HYME